MMRNVFFTLFIMVILWDQSLRPILDGRSTPIYLDSVYTFTPGEWARGSVFFRKGFDLPIGGTVYLGIDGGFVNGPIHLNKGTLVLEKDLWLNESALIYSSGFITANDQTSNTITYSCPKLWANEHNETIYILSSLNFQATSSKASIDQQGGLIDCSKSPYIAFINGKIVLRYIKFGTATSVNFYGCDITTAEGLAPIEASTLYFYSDCTLTVLQSVTMNTLAVGAGNRMIIYPNPRGSLRLKQISIPYPATRLEIRNTSLEFVDSANNPIRMITPYAHNQQGVLSFVGNSKLSSPTNKILIFDKYGTLEMQTGASIIISSNTYLRLE